MNLIEKLENPSPPKLLVNKQASVGASKFAILFALPMYLSIISIMFMPFRKKPTRALKRGISGFRIVLLKKITIDDFDGLVTFHLQNNKSITVELCNILFVKGGIFVADTDIERKHVTK